MPAFQLNYTKSNPIAKREMYNGRGRNVKAEKILAVLAAHLEPSRPLCNLLLLDVSCSTGLMAKAFARRVHRVVAIDIDHDAITHAMAHNSANNIDYYLMNALHIGLPDDSFDVVVCNQMYEHVSDAQLMMDEVRRVLKPGGVCYFGATNRLKIIETHYGRIPFLSYFPKPLAHRYLKWLGKGEHYYETLYTYWGLTRLTQKFQTVDYTRRIIADPDRFYALDIFPVGSLMQCVAKLVARIAYPLMPGYVWLLIKPDDRHGA